MTETSSGAGAATRWIGVGHSQTANTIEAAREATALALEGREAALLIVLSSSSFDIDAVPGAVLAAAGGGVPLIGCTTAGEIAADLAGSGRLVVIALGGSGLTVETARGSLADGPRAAAIEAAAGIGRVDRPQRVLMLLTDGLAGSRSEVVRGAYSVAGAGVPLIGGCAGDDLTMRQTHQFYGDEALTGAVIGAAIGSDGPIGIGIGHGWQRFGEPIVVTESDGERIMRLDDRPALDYYLDRVNAPREVYDDERVWQLESLFHPLGLPRPGGEEVRAVLGADYHDRSLLCGDVPQGTMISIMQGSAETVTAGTQDACDGALAMLEGHAPVGLVAFDCAARRAILGDDGIRAELEQIRASFPGVPVGGFYTYGEIARTRGSRGVHNATLVMLALA